MQFPPQGTATPEVAAETLDEVNVVERHLHNQEFWFGIASPQTATNWALRTGLAPFIATSGNDDFGTDPGDTAQVLGTGDTPVNVGSTYFDFHRFSIIDVSNATMFILRIIWGTASQTADEAEAAGQYSETVAHQQTAAGQNKPVDIYFPRVAAGSQVWVKAKNATNNATIQFIVGIHEYPAH